MEPLDNITFPELFGDYIFTPTFIRNLLEGATLTSQIVVLTPQEIYFCKRELETNNTYLKELRETIRQSRRVIFIIFNCAINMSFDLQKHGDLLFNDLLELEWLRYMYLEVLRRETIKLEYILKQLKINVNTEVQELIKELRRIRVECNTKDRRIKNLIKSYFKHIPRFY